MPAIKTGGVMRLPPFSIAGDGTFVKPSSFQWGGHIFGGQLRSKWPLLWTPDAVTGCSQVTQSVINVNIPPKFNSIRRIPRAVLVPWRQNAVQANYQSLAASFPKAFVSNFAQGGGPLLNPTILPASSIMQVQDTMPTQFIVAIPPNGPTDSFHWQTVDSQFTQISLVPQADPTQWLGGDVIAFIYSDLGDFIRNNSIKFQWGMGDITPGDPTSAVPVITLETITWTLLANYVAALKVSFELMASCFRRFNLVIIYNNFVPPQPTQGTFDFVPGEAIPYNFPISHVGDPTALSVAAWQSIGASSVEQITVNTTGRLVADSDLLPIIQDKASSFFA